MTTPSPVPKIAPSKNPAPTRRRLIPTSRQNAAVPARARSVRATEAGEGRISSFPTTAAKTAQRVSQTAAGMITFSSFLSIYYLMFVGTAFAWGVSAGGAEFFGGI